MSDTPSARQIAHRALMRIEQDGAYANIVLPQLMSGSDLDARDRRFATELVYGTTRMRRACDHLLRAHYRNEPPAEAMTALRLGVHQLHFMDVDDYAAVSETVDLVPKRLKGFVNGVLRSVTRSEVRWPDRATRLSYPDWIDAWATRAFGDDAERVLSVMNQPAIVARRDDGYVQDPASQAVVALVDARPEHRVVDLCAAPGGKTTALAGDVIAVEENEARLGLLQRNLARLDSSALPVRADAARLPVRQRSFDRVLLDAPCSGLGVLRRRPDARWRIMPDDIGRLASQQTAMLTAAAELVADGGRLVYSVCTLTEAETVEVAASVGGEFREASLPKGWDRCRIGGRLVPDSARDGMYAAIWERQR